MALTVSKAAKTTTPLRRIDRPARGQGDRPMKSKKNWVAVRHSLRIQAEGLAAGISTPAPQAPPTDVILHELLVHKIELEMQVEELRRAHDALEETCDRYLEIYEFAPVGYVSLNQDGLITEINLTGANLFGVDRIKLIHGRFARFVAPADQDAWHRLFMNQKMQAEVVQTACVLELARGDGSSFHAYLECQGWQVIDGIQVLRLALFDINKIRAAEQHKGEDSTP
jgi:PAS domain S-box-containing protein